MAKVVEINNFIVSIEHHEVSLEKVGKIIKNVVVVSNLWVEVKGVFHDQKVEENIMDFYMKGGFSSYQNIHLARVENLVRVVGLVNHEVVVNVSKNIKQLTFVEVKKVLFHVLDDVSILEGKRIEIWAKVFETDSNSMEIFNRENLRKNLVKKQEILDVFWEVIQIKTANELLGIGTIRVDVFLPIFVGNFLIIKEKDYVKDLTFRKLLRVYGYFDYADDDNYFVIRKSKNRKKIFK